MYDNINAYVNMLVWFIIMQLVKTIFYQNQYLSMLEIKSNHVSKMGPKLYNSKQPTDYDPTFTDVCSYGSNWQ